MARIRATKITKDDTGLVNSLTVVLPTHATGDCLLIFIGHDTADTDFSLPSGWSAGPTGVVGSGTGTNTVRGSSFYKVAASGSETNPTFTWTTANEVIAQAISIEGSHATPVDASTSATDSSGAPYTSGTVTTNYDKSLVFTACISDGGVQPTAYPGATITCAEDAAAVGMGVCWFVKAIAGATTAVNFYCGGNADESAILTIAIRDGSSGAIMPAYLQSGYATVVDPTRGTTAIASVSYATDSTRFYNLGGTSKSNPTSVLQVDVSPLTYVDLTTAATNGTDADVAPFPATEAIGDYFAIGYSSTFDTVVIDRASCTNGAGGVCTYEYWNGSAWAALSQVMDGTASTAGQAFRLGASDKQVFKFAIPTNWATLSLNGETADYKIRFVVSTVYSTNPTCSQIWVANSLYFCTYDAFTSNADTGVNLYEASSNVSPQAASYALAGNCITIGSSDFSTGIILATFQPGTPRDYLDLGPSTYGGGLIGLLDASNNFRGWSVCYFGDTDTDADGRNVAAIQPGQSSSTAWYTGASGAPTASAITGILIANSSRNGSAVLRFSQIIHVPGYCTISGGGTTYPLAWSDVVNALNGYSFPILSRATGVCRVPLKFGGQDALNIDASLFAVTFPYVTASTATASKCHVDPSTIGVIIDARAVDVCKLRLGTITGLSKIVFNFLSTASASATYDFNGLSVINADVTLRAVCTFTGMLFVNCTTFTQNTAVITGCTFSGSKITCDDPSKISGCGFTSSGTGHALELTTAGSYNFTGNTFTGYGADASTDAAIYNNSGGAITLTLGSGDPTPTVRNGAGASTTIVAFTADITVTSNEANTLLQIFTTATQTVLASTTGTSLVYTHSGETVDIVAQKAGFLPQRITGVVLSGTMSQPFTMADDYNYDAAHGLTYTTDASWSRANNQLTVPSWGPSIRAVYSLMIDAFIAESSLRNTAFNLSMNGPTTLFLVNGAEGATDASITNMTVGGVRYLTAAGATAAEFVGVQSSGVVAGCQAEYELGAGGTITDARATGNVNEIIKAYGDATHGNFDKRGHLQFKVQCNGYRQSEYDVVASYGLSAVEPTLYIISLPMPEITGLTLGDPSITGVTITDDSAAPVSWDAGDGAKDYSITITDAGTNSGEDILRWLNYNLSLDAVFQGKEPFYWPEMVLDNGPSYETLRGWLHDNPDIFVGVRVIRTGGTPHPDFSRFQADDGTYGTPPTVATGSISGILAGSKVRIYNQTTAAEFYIGTPGTSYTDVYTDGTDFTTGDNIQVTVHKRGYLTFQTTVVASASGWTVSVNQAEDEVYTALAVDGATVTGFAADYVNDEVNVTVAANFNIADMYAWWNYNLESDDGIREFVGGMTALDIGNFRINNATVDIYIDNTTATNLRQLDNRRIFRNDGAYPVKSSGGGGIDVVWRNTILLAETGVSGLTAEESAQLAVIGGLNVASGAVEANIKYVNDIAVAGVGTSGNPWGPA